MELGERVMGENVSIWDDGADPSGMPAPDRLRGRRRAARRPHHRWRSPAAVVHDAATGARAGTGSTGHALPGAEPRTARCALNLFMAPGTTPRDELIRGIKRGVWVTRFHYINPVHPKKAILTGMTKDGTFLIEDGQLTRPLLQLPVHAVDPRGVQRRARREPHDEAAAGRILRRARACPALHLGSFNFTGTTVAEGDA